MSGLLIKQEVVEMDEVIYIDVIDEVPKKKRKTKPTKRQRTLCEHCGSMFLTQESYNNHVMSVHSMMKGFSPLDIKVLCPHCGLSCPNGRSFKRHMVKHMIKCPDCPLLFKTESELKEHQWEHIPVQHSCSECDLVLENSEELIVHIKEIHNPSKPFLCTRCSFVSNEIEEMRQHLKIHEGRPVFTCNVCGKKYVNQTLFKTHQEIHEDVKKYSCDICGRKFVTDKYLKIHRSLNHHKELYGYEVSYSCQECGRKFSFEKSLRRHLTRIHKIGVDTTVSCPVCLKKICNNYNLKVHMRIHTGEKTNMCDLCGKSYHIYKSYKKHVLVHHPGYEPVPKTAPKQFSKGLKKDVDL